MPLRRDHPGQSGNFTLSAFSLFVDQLRLAADEGDLSRPILARWSIMASTDDPIPASLRGQCQPHQRLRRSGAIRLHRRGRRPVLHAGRQADAATLAYLRQAAAAWVPLIGMCTGSFILSRAGLMIGRRCCVSWYHRQDFMDEFPAHTPVADRMFVVDGDRITCSGGGGAADLASHLIELRSMGARRGPEEPAMCCCSTAPAAATTPSRTRRSAPACARGQRPPDRPAPS